MALIVQQQTRPIFHFLSKIPGVIGVLLLYNMYLSIYYN